MISLTAVENQMSALPTALYAIGSESERVSRILDYAEFLGYLEDGKGAVGQQPADIAAVETPQR